MKQNLLTNGLKEETPVFQPIRQIFDFQAAGEPATRMGAPTRTPAGADLRDRNGEASKQVDKRLHAAAESVVVA